MTKKPLDCQEFKLPSGAYHAQIANVAREGNSLKFSIKYDEPPQPKPGRYYQKHVEEGKEFGYFDHSKGRYEFRHPDRRKRPLSEEVWYSNEGPKAVKDMDEKHIHNCITFLIRYLKDIAPHKDKESEKWLWVFEQELENRRVNKLLDDCDNSESELLLGNHEENEGDQVMTNYSAAAFIVSDEVLAVDVEFEGIQGLQMGKRYTYKSLVKDLKVGDNVVAPFGSAFLVGKVVSLDADITGKSHLQFKWLVQKVDFGNYNQVLENEANMIVELKKVDRKAQRQKLRQNWIEHGGDAINNVKLVTDLTVKAAEDDNSQND